MLFCLRTLEILNLLKHYKMNELSNICYSVSGPLRSTGCWRRWRETRRSWRDSVRTSTLIWRRRWTLVERMKMSIWEKWKKGYIVFSRWGRWKTDWPQWRPGNSRNWLKLVSSCQLMSQTRKNTESMKCIFFLQKGANLERQYEDRVQKMLSELREVSRYINYKCCVCLSFCVFGWFACYNFKGYHMLHLFVIL